MTANQIFSLPRFFNLFREETSSGYRMTIIISIVIFAFLLFLSTLMSSQQEFIDFHHIWYSIVLLGGGFYFTSNSFNELNQKEQRMQYLSLPTSIFEKFSMKLLITTVGYVIGATLLYWVFATIAEAIAANFNWSFIAFDPTAPFFMLMIKLYLVIQSIFILGAATFGKLSFFKTIFTLNLLGLAIGVVCWIFFRVIFAEYFEGFFMPRDDILVIPDKGFQNFVEHTLWPTVQNVFWYALAPFCWIVAYFKLKEQEV